MDNVIISSETSSDDKNIDVPSPSSSHELLLVNKNHPLTPQMLLLDNDNEVVVARQQQTTTTTALVQQNATNSHPLMYSPVSSISPVDLSDSNYSTILQPELKLMNHNYHYPSHAASIFFEPQAHSSLVDEKGALGAADFDHNQLTNEIPPPQLPSEDSPSPPPPATQNFDNTSDTENDKSIYEARLSSDLQNVSLTMNEKEGNLNFLAHNKRSNKLRLVKVLPTQELHSSSSSSLDSITNQLPPTANVADTANDDDNDESGRNYCLTNTDYVSNGEIMPQAVIADNSDNPMIVQSTKKLRLIKVSPMKLSEDDDDSDDVSSLDSNVSSLDSHAQDSLATPEHIVCAGEDGCNAPGEIEENNHSSSPKPIESVSAVDERHQRRNWQRMVLPGGEQRTIDMRVIEPYKCVLSHGGYVRAGGNTAIVIFKACFLPDKSRVDYDYVMDNLFLYVLWTLDRLVTDDYVLVYLHGGATRLPAFIWMKRCYQMVGWKLRKNLSHLYLVHPTFWIRTMLFMAKPFISSKFYRKISYVHTLKELCEQIPLEATAIPDKVKAYDSLHCTM